jgi:branched-chain amino acid transport system ATP-binding protein
MLEIRDLNARYGQAQALFDISLQVAAGSMVLVQGLNGAGKSTLLKSVMGLLPQVTGKVYWHGDEISSLPPHLRSAKGLGYVPEDRRLFAALTVRQNLEIAVPQRSKSISSEVPAISLEAVSYTHLRAHETG